VRAVVLVGGKGTRLRPLTLTTPKQMLPVNGRPMIERVLEHLAGHGIDEVVLSLGYQPDAFMDAYPDGRCGGVRLQYAVEDHPLDTAGAIAFAARSTGIDETFIVVNGDVLTDLDVGALVELHRSRGAEATIALTPVDDPSRYGVVPTDGEGRVQDFIEKPPPGEAPTNLINAGTYVLEPSVLDLIPPDEPTSVERRTFPQLVERGTLFALGSPAAWVDAGTPATFLRVNLEAAGTDGVHPEARVADGAEVADSVIGRRAVVGDGAVVRQSVLFDDVQVGAGARIEGAIVGYRCQIADGAVVEAGAVLGDGTAVPAGV
jgi:mannose-1-phosphate guanylyltransferase